MIVVIVGIESQVVGCTVSRVRSSKDACVCFEPKENVLTDLHLSKESIYFDTLAFPSNTRLIILSDVTVGVKADLEGFHYKRVPSFPFS